MLWAFSSYLPPTQDTSDAVSLANCNETREKPQSVKYRYTWSSNTSSMICVLTRKYFSQRTIRYLSHHSSIVSSKEGLKWKGSSLWTGAFATADHHLREHGLNMIVIFIYIQILFFLAKHCITLNSICSLAKILSTTLFQERAQWTLTDANARLEVHNHPVIQWTVAFVFMLYKGVVITCGIWKKGQELQKDADLSLNKNFLLEQHSGFSISLL